MILKPNRGEVLRRSIGSAIVVLLVLVCTHRSSTQVCKSPALESDVPSHGANELITLRPVKVSIIRGRVADANGAAVMDAVIDVFAMDKTVRKRLLGITEGNVESFKSFRADKTGEFCLDLPFGSYELRFGTEGPSGFNQTILLVRKIRSGSRKSIEIFLTPGT
jgi:hypothetical protein